VFRGNRRTCLIHVMPTEQMSRRQASGTNGEALRARWRRWMPRIHAEIRDLVISRHIFSTVADMVNKNESSRKHFDYHSWSIRNYAFCLSVSIRRLMDNDPRSVSLARLLDELSRNAQVVTRESHRCLWPARMRAAADPTFDGIAGVGEGHLPPGVPRHDLAQLGKAHRRTRMLVNKQLAHLDQRNLQRKPPSIAEMQDVVSLFEETFRKYGLLLKAWDPQYLPTWQYDWTSVFEVRWKADNRWLAH
jgi:hypothetical protein